jgi:nucleoside-diphosphate-sugar epimerase
MSLKLAIIGANGFIGGRAVELFHLTGLAEVRPVVRSISSLARLSRFDLDCRIADACDQAALRAALDGCDAVIHSVSGDHATILGSLTPVYMAAQEVGVQRLVYLSSASVHGQAPPPGTDESTPLSERQPLAYSNAKVRAERQLLKLRQTGSVELVILRPGIVVGPRSYWVDSFASGLLAGTAYVVNHGQGLCNSIYVDNLVDALHLATTVPGVRVDRQAFLVGDAETVSWADLYAPIAHALGFELSQVPNLEYVKPRYSWKRSLRALSTSGPARSIRRVVPRRLRRALRAAMMEETPSSSPWADVAELPARGPGLTATLEMALLHSCACKLPYTKAKQALGYEPKVSFGEASRRTIEWLKFSGYPVKPFTWPAQPAPGANGARDKSSDTDKAGTPR